MKLLIFITFGILQGASLGFMKIGSFIENSYIDIMADAVALATREKFDSTTLNLISSENLETQSFKDVLLPKLDMIRRLETIDKIGGILRQRRRVVLILVNKCKEFSKAFLKISIEYFRLNGLYLVIILDDDITEVEEIFIEFMRAKIFNANVMHRGYQGTIEVKTFIPFRRDNCSDSNPTLINRFENGKFLNENFFLKKTKNLHKCSVRVATSENVYPYVYWNTLPDGRQVLRGIDMTTIKALGDSLNFHVNITHVGPIGHFYTNGSYKGPLKSLYDSESDLSISTWLLKAYRLNFFDASTPYIYDQVILAIPSGADLTTFQKLVFPFSSWLWIWLFGCFAAAVLSIFVVNRQTQDVQSFVFGENVKNPTINLMIAIIGGSQSKLPRTNFARFLLMIFLWFTLVFRSLYQGSFYKLFETNIRHPEVQTVDNMIEKDFEFYVFYTGVEDALKGTESIRNRLRTIPENEQTKYLSKIRSDSSFKGAYGNTLTLLLGYNHKHSNLSRIKICKEIVITTPIVIYTQKDFYLLEALNEKISLFQSAGLIEYWRFKDIDKAFQVDTEKTIRKPLSFDQVAGSFEILIVGLISAVIICAAEIAADKLKLVRNLSVDMEGI